MDHLTLGKGMQALQWEANYRKKSASDTSVSNQFLTPYDNLDPDFEKQLSLLNITQGKVLDIGTGTGEQAISLAKKGFEVTATDVSASALDAANVNAKQFGADIKFTEDNILLSKLTGEYDLVFDRGCFTLIPNKYKPEYISTIKKLLKPGGWLFLKADKGKKDNLNLLKSDATFREHALFESSYASLNGKIISAMVLIMQKIHKE